MQMIEEKVDDIYIYKLSGRLDSNTSIAFEEKIMQTIEGGSNHVIVDFENIEFLSSAGLRALLNITKDLNRRAGKIVLCSMAEYVREVFAISGFDTIMTIVSSLDGAIKEF